MSERTYIVAFYPLNPNFESLAVKNAIKHNTSFPNWWNHIATVFLVKTALSAEKISKFVKSGAGRKVSRDGGRSAQLRRDASEAVLGLDHLARERTRPC